MSKTINTLILKITLPENFKDNLVDFMEEKIQVAEKKWGVKLNDEQKDLVCHNAWIQLNFEVKEVYGTNWESKDSIEVHVPHYKNDRIPIPSKTSEKTKKRLIKNKQQWIIDQEDSSDAVYLSDFHNVVRKEIEEWAETAVLYGVGSYV